MRRQFIVKRSKILNDASSFFVLVSSKDSVTKNSWIDFNFKEN